MAKTQQTLSIEALLYKSVVKLGAFGCPEVTIGFWGDERVDFLSVDTKGIFRAYEIKVTKADFHSTCKNSFVGHFNYYVLPHELYLQVKDEIPSYVGVWVDGSIVKKPKRVEPSVSPDVLRMSLIRSLSRDAGKYMAAAIKGVEIQDKLQDDAKKRNSETIRRLRAEVRSLRKEIAYWTGRRSLDLQERSKSLEYYQRVAHRSAALVRLYEAWLFRKDTD